MSLMDTDQMHVQTRKGLEGYRLVRFGNTPAHYVTIEHLIGGSIRVIGECARRGLDEPYPCSVEVELEDFLNALGLTEETLKRYWRFREAARSKNGGENGAA
jgi:hypothetical protein